MKKKAAEKVKEKAEARKKREKQTKFVFAMMIVLLIAVVGTYFIADSLRTFSYGGMKFQKANQGGRILWMAKIPVAEYEGKPNSISFGFREDPRELGDIEINGAIRLKQNTALVADSKLVESCEDSILAGTTLAVYLRALGVNPYPAAINKSEAIERDVKYASCNDTATHSIIIFEEGERDRIIQEGDCYKLEIANCNFMNVTERFMIGWYAHSKNITI